MLDARQRRLMDEVARRLERGEALFPDRWIRDERITEQEQAELRYYMAAAVVGWLMLNDRERARVLRIGAERIYGPLQGR